MRWVPHDMIACENGEIEPPDAQTLPEASHTESFQIILHLEVAVDHPDEGGQEGLHYQGLMPPDINGNDDVEVLGEMVAEEGGIAEMSEDEDEDPPPEEDDEYAYGNGEDTDDGGDQDGNAGGGASQNAGPGNHDNQLNEDQQENQGSDYGDWGGQNGGNMETNNNQLQMNGPEEKILRMERRDFTTDHNDLGCSVSENLREIVGPMPEKCLPAMRSQLRNYIDSLDATVTDDVSVADQTKYDMLEILLFGSHAWKFEMNEIACSCWCADQQKWQHNLNMFFEVSNVWSNLRNHGFELHTQSSSTHTLPGDFFDRRLDQDSGQLQQKREWNEGKDEKSKLTRTYSQISNDCFSFSHFHS